MYSGYVREAVVFFTEYSTGFAAIDEAGCRNATKGIACKGKQESLIYYKLLQSERDPCSCEEH